MSSAWLVLPTAPIVASKRVLDRLVASVNADLNLHITDALEVVSMKCAPAFISNANEVKHVPYQPQRSAKVSGQALAEYRDTSKERTELSLFRRHTARGAGVVAATAATRRNLRTAGGRCLLHTCRKQ